MAEVSVIVTYLPEVIGKGIMCILFFGWPCWVGVLASLLMTMRFLITIHVGMQMLENIIVCFIRIMSVILFVELSFVNQDKGVLVKRMDL